MIPSFEVENYASRYFTILFELDTTKNNKLILESILNDINDYIGTNIKINTYFFKNQQIYNNIMYNALMNIELLEISLLSSFIIKVEKFKENVDCDYINIKMVKTYNIDTNYNTPNIYSISIKNGYIEKN